MHSILNNKVISSSFDEIGPTDGLVIHAPLESVSPYPNNPGGTTYFKKSWKPGNEGGWEAYSVNSRTEFRGSFVRTYCTTLGQSFSLRKIDFNFSPTSFPIVAVEIRASKNLNFGLLWNSTGVRSKYFDVTTEWNVYNINPVTSANWDNQGSITSLWFWVGGTPNNTQIDDYFDIRFIYVGDGSYLPTTIDTISGLTVKPHRTVVTTVNKKKYLTFDNTYDDCHAVLYHNNIGFIRHDLPVSVSMIVRDFSVGTKGPYIFCYPDGANNNRLYVSGTNTSVSVANGDGVSIVQSVDWTKDVLIVAVRNPINQTQYLSVNGGTFISGAYLQGSSFDPARLIYFGSWTGTTQNSNMKIRDFRLYNRILTMADVQLLNNLK